MSPTINLLEELDSISKLHWLDRNDIDHIMLDIAKRIALALRVERVNVWLLNNNNTELVSIGEYDTRDQQFKRDSVLYKKDLPHYFSALEENKIIHAPDIHQYSATLELDQIYSIPFGIESLLDIPIRIDGELIGVMCFEKVNHPKVFTEDEQSFAFSVACVLASNLEARQRRAAQHKLELALEEKELILKEMNHRVKNNFAILISLLRIGKNSNAKKDPKIIYDEYEQRIQSMLKIHDLLSESDNYSLINLSSYIRELVKAFAVSHSDIKHQLALNINYSDFVYPTHDAVHLGLIVSEVLINSYKYGQSNDKGFMLNVTLTADVDDLELCISDNGSGFDFHSALEGDSMGLSIIKDLCDTLQLKTEFPKKGSSKYRFKIPT